MRSWKPPGGEYLLDLYRVPPRVQLRHSRSQGHYYHLPINVYGFSTNAHVLDIQSGFERALNAAVPALAGADELSGIGEMEAGVMGCFAQMVCDNEIAASVRRMLRGFPADEDALAIEVIAAAMSGRRNFLTERHTTRYLPGGEILLTHLAERNPWDSWEEAGKQEMVERSQNEAERILAEHQVPPLSPEQEQELDNIMAAAELELVNN
jgi:trimethylamine--corrinoid protein Co-methyltransferase